MYCKQDIQVGDIITIAAGLRIVIVDSYDSTPNNVCAMVLQTFNCVYNDDLTYSLGNTTDRDIAKVERNGKVIWKRVVG